MKIHPAILVTNIQEYERQIRLAKTYTDEVDVDIIDWDRTEISTITIEQVLNIDTSLRLNLDLMMNYPLQDQESGIWNLEFGIWGRENSILETKSWIFDSRINRVIINTECKQDLKQVINFIKSTGKKAGLSLNPEDDPSLFVDLFPSLDMIQIFTIEPGAQGNKFIPEKLEIIKTVKDLGFRGLIGVDGGVNLDTLQVIKKYPIDVASAGSALSKAKDPAKIFIKMTRLTS